MLKLQKIVIDNVEISSNTREVYCANNVIKMTGLEFNLLWLLMESAPLLVFREYIAEHIFNSSLIESSYSINTHISNARKKLLASDGDSRIKAIRGEGYLFISR